MGAGDENGFCEERFGDGLGEGGAGDVVFEDGEDGDGDGLGEDGDGDVNELGAGDKEDGDGDCFCDGVDDVQGLGEDGDGGVDGEEGDDVGVGSPDVNSGSKSKRRCCHDVNILPNATFMWGCETFIQT